MIYLSTPASFLASILTIRITASDILRGWDKLHGMQQDPTPLHEEVNCFFPVFPTILLNSPIWNRNLDL